MGLGTGRRGIAAASALALALIGCSPNPQPVAVNNSAAEAEARAEQDRAAQRDCIATVLKETINRSRADPDNYALDLAFQAQDVGNCPQDFSQQFVAAANAVHLLHTAQSDLNAHLARRDEAQQASIQTTVGEVWNGRPSGNTPWIDWLNRKSELETLIEQRRQAFEESKAALRNVAASYGVALNASPPSDSGEMHGTDAANVSSGNTM